MAYAPYRDMPECDAVLAQSACKLEDLGDRLNKCNAHLRDLHERLTRIADRTFGGAPEPVEANKRLTNAPTGTLGTVFALVDEIVSTASTIEKALNRLEPL